MGIPFKKLLLKIFTPNIFLNIVANAMNTRWSSRRLAPVLSGTEGTAITLKQRLPLTSIIIYSILSLIEGVFLRFISKKITAATIAPAIIPIIPGVPKKYPTAAPINSTIIYVSVFILFRTPYEDMMALRRVLGIPSDLWA